MEQVIKRQSLFYINEAKQDKMREESIANKILTPGEKFENCIAMHAQLSELKFSRLPTM